MTKRKKLIIISLIGTALITLGLVIFLTNKKAYSQNEQLDDHSPISYIEQINPTSYSLSNAEYKFKDLDSFLSINRYSEIDQAQFCYGNFAQRVVPIIYDYYHYSKNGKEVFGQVVDNLGEYLDSQPILDTYNLYTDLLNGKINLDNSPNSFHYLGIFSRWCGETGQGNEPIYIEPINYIGADNAYLVIFGEGLTTIKNDYGISLAIVSQIGNKFAVYQTNKNFSEVAYTTNINECMEPISFPVASSEHPVFYKVYKDCITYKLSMNKNQDKLDAVINNILTVFELKTPNL